jgi:hypothetical protein
VSEAIDGQPGARARAFSCASALLDVVTEAGLPPGPLDTVDSISLLHALPSVPDPRQARGRRRGLQSVLLLAVGAVLAGARSYAGIAHWARCADQAVSVCGVTPHATTFGRVLAAVDPAALQLALTGWVWARRQARRGQRAPDARPRGEGGRCWPSTVRRCACDTRSHVMSGSQQSRVRQSGVRRPPAPG